MSPGFPRAGLLLTLALLTGGCLSFHQGPMPGEPTAATATPDASMRPAYLDVDGVRVRFTDRGQGPAVVLLHGFASALETWDGVDRSLRCTHRVLSLDLKGFGWTARPEGDYSPAAQARLVLALLDARGVKRFSVVAHSWGSSVALALALAAPERVDRVALYDAWVYDDQIPAFFRWARVDGLGETLFALFYNERVEERLALGFYDPNVITHRFVGEVLAALERPGTRAAALAAVRGQNFSAMEARYRRIDKPVLLLWGDEDRVSMPRFARRLVSELPRATLKSYPRCGHFPMIEAASASTRDLKAFLQEGTP